MFIPRYISLLLLLIVFPFVCSGQYGGQSTADLATSSDLAGYLPLAGGTVSGPMTNAVGIYGDGSGITNLPSASLNNALSINRPNIGVAVSGTNYVATIDAADGADTLDYYFDQQIVQFPVPTNVNIYAASATNVIQENYIYANSATQLLVSTTYPLGERAILFNVDTPTTNELATKGVKTHRYTEMVAGPDDRSRISHIGDRIRQLGSSWDSGSYCTVRTNSGNLYVSVATGVVWQMHRQACGSLDSETNGIMVLNGFDQQKNFWVTNLTQLAGILDADGDATLDSVQDRFGVEVVYLIGSGGTNTSSSLGLLLSNGDYQNESEAISDVDNLQVTSVDENLRHMAVRLGRIVLRNVSGTFSAIVQDKRGLPLGASSGASGTPPAVTVFADNEFQLFSNADTTNTATFNLDQLSDSRVYEFPDKTGTVALLSDVGGSGGGAFEHSGGLGIYSTNSSANTATGAYAFAAGFDNTTPANYGVISGGGGNSVAQQASYGTVSGGQGNAAGNGGDTHSTVCGGQSNVAYDKHTTVCGGINNTANATWAIVVGGKQNESSGIGSIAMGTEANATHNGSLVAAGNLTSPSVGSLATRTAVLGFQGGTYIVSDDATAASGSANSVGPGQLGLSHNTNSYITSLAPPPILAS